MLRQFFFCMNVCMYAYIKYFIRITRSTGNRAHILYSRVEHSYLASRNHACASSSLSVTKSLCQFAVSFCGRPGSNLSADGSHFAHTLLPRIHLKRLLGIRQQRHRAHKCEMIMGPFPFHKTNCRRERARALKAHNFTDFLLLLAERVVVAVSASDACDVMLWTFF